MNGKITGAQMRQRKLGWVAKQLKDKKSYVLSLFIGSKEIVPQFANDIDQSLVTDKDGVRKICGKNVTFIKYSGRDTV
jgi:hypothetical protein